MSQTNFSPSNRLHKRKAFAWPVSLAAKAREFFGSSLAIKLPAIVIALFILAFVVSTGLSVQTSRAALIEQLENALVGDSQAHAELIRAHLIWTRSLAIDLASLASATEQNEENLLNAIKSTLANNEQVFGSTIAYEPYQFKSDLYYWSPYYSRTPDGNLRFTQLGNPEYNYFNWEWYTLPKEKRVPVLSPPYYDEGGGNIWMVTWSVPFNDQNGNFKGVATADIAFSQTQEIVRQIEVGKQGYAFLIDSQGTLLGIGTQGGDYDIMVDSMLTGQESPGKSDWTDLIHAMMNGDSGFMATTDPRGLPVFVAYYPIGLDTGWSLGLAYPQNELFLPATLLRNRLIGFAAVVLTLFAAVMLLFTRSITTPLLKLTRYTAEFLPEQLEKSKAFQPIEIHTGDELERLADSFNLMGRNLKEAFETLEDKVAERTHSLELAAEVGRSISQLHDLDTVLKEAVEIIRAQFDLYYVQIYLANPTQTTLTLRSGTGTVGAELLSRGHSLPINSASINGRAAMEKRPIIISDTAASASFRPNALLPDTRSEMAVPLMIGQQVVGVLDIQSDQSGALSQEILPAFEALAGQLAIAIQNANLLDEANAARAEVEKQAARLARAHWQDYLDAIHKPEQIGFVYEQNKIAPLSETETAGPSAGNHSLAAPIAVSGETLGSLMVELEEQTANPQAKELITTVARQVAQQIENLRLLESAERYRREAEQAIQRLTIEGWKKFMESRGSARLGYLYDSKEIRPLTDVQPPQDSAIALPIKSRDETVGQIAILGIEAENLEALELASAVAERLGTHIENLRLFEETKQSQIELEARARQLEAVAEISATSSRELDLDKMLHTVVHLTQRKFGLYHAHVFLYDETSNSLNVAACGWKEGDPHEGTDGTASIPLQKEQSLVARAARTRQAVISNDVHSDPAWLPNPLLPDTASEMAVPLVVGNQLLGVLDVQSDRLNAFTQEDVAIQSTLAAQVATALQNARSYAKAQQQAEREAMLNVISQKIQSATSVEAVLQIAARELGRALGAPLTIAQLGVKDGK